MQAVDLRVLTGSVTTCALSVPVDFSLQRLVVLKIPRTTAASFTSGGIQKSQYPVSGCVQHSSTDKWGLAWTSNNNRTSLAFCVLVFKLNTFLFSFYQNICYRSANFILEKKNVFAGGVILLGVIAATLFPIWPPFVRVGVYYLSIVGGVFIGSIFAIAMGKCRVWGLCHQTVVAHASLCVIAPRNTRQAALSKFPSFQVFISRLHACRTYAPSFRVSCHLDWAPWQSNVVSVSNAVAITIHDKWPCTSCFVFRRAYVKKQITVFEGQ